MSELPVVERATKSEIQEFLATRRIAIVGVSRNPRDFSRTLFHEFETRGYDVIPVNPAVADVNGRKCFRSVADVMPAVKAALLMTPPSVTEQVVRDCQLAGVRHVWMYQAGGVGAGSPAAIAFCREHGMKIVTGECPLMFLPGAGFPHRLHGFIKRITGTYPR